MREIFEETSIDQFQPLSGFRETSSYQLHRNGQPIAKTVAYYLAETTERDVALSTEHTAFQWLGFEDALAVLTYDESRRVLCEANRLLAASSAARERGDPQ